MAVQACRVGGHSHEVSLLYMKGLRIHQLGTVYSFLATVAVYRFVLTAWTARLLCAETIHRSKVWNTVDGQHHALSSTPNLKELWNYHTLVPQVAQSKHDV